VQNWPAKLPAKFNFVGPVNDPSAFAIHSKMVSNMQVLASGTQMQQQCCSEMFH
jgi:hypothetical protein